MNRVDHKVERKYPEGTAWVSAEDHNGSTVELSGGWREAQLIVRGLHILRAQKMAADALGLAVTEDWKLSDPFGSVGEAPSLKEIETLLDSIQNPNFVDQAIVPATVYR